jgi:hypothetical protein
MTRSSPSSSPTTCPSTTGYTETEEEIKSEAQGYYEELVLAGGLPSRPIQSEPLPCDLSTGDAELHKINHWSSEIRRASYELRRWTTFQNLHGHRTQTGQSLSAKLEGLERYLVYITSLLQQPAKTNSTSNAEERKNWLRSIKDKLEQVLAAHKARGLRATSLVRNDRKPRQSGQTEPMTKGSKSGKTPGVGRAIVGSQSNSGLTKISPDKRERRSSRRCPQESQGKKVGSQPRERYPIPHERPSDPPTISSHHLATEGPLGKTFPSGILKTTTRAATLSAGIIMHSQKVLRSSGIGKRDVSSKQNARSRSRHTLNQVSDRRPRRGKWQNPSTSTELRRSQRKVRKPERYSPGCF